VLADLGSTGLQYFNAGIAVPRAYLASHRDVAVKLVAALAEAVQLFKSDRDVAFKAIAAQDKIIDPDILAKTWAFYKKYWADPPLVSPAAMLAATRLSVNAKTRALDDATVASMYDNSVLEEALKGK
jgi:ABC-type nitrate/sulfonate/bicarbonate transport system substrate-binding protein